jgi:dipeptidyl-peptidase 4
MTLSALTGLFFPLMTTAVAVAVTGVGIAACNSSSGSGPGATQGEKAAPALSAAGADDGFIEQYAVTRRFRAGRPRQPTVVPGGDAILFLRSGPRDVVDTLYEYNVKTSTEEAVLTAEQILKGAKEELSSEEVARRERLRLMARGIASYELSKDGKSILVPLSGRLFVIDRASDAITELPNEGGYANEARFSPDAKRVACVREGDLYVIDVEAGTQRRLTTTATNDVTNGIPEFVAQEEMSRYAGYWFSPDSQTLLYQETDTTKVEKLYAFNPMEPEKPPHASPFPRAGRANADVRLGFISVLGGETTWIEREAAAFPYVATVRWGKEGPLVMLVQDRAQRDERLLRVDPATGKTGALLSEKDAAWLNLDQSVPRFVDGKRFLWSTEREGRWALEVANGTPKEPAVTLTPADLRYESLLHVDAKAGVAWFSGTKDPTETHVYRVPLAGGAPTALTDAPGAHHGVFGEDTDVWVHVSDTIANGEKVTVRRGDAVVGELRSVAETPNFASTPEYVTVGERGLHAMVSRPRDFQEGRSYPVLLSVYAGPGVNRVRKSKHDHVRAQWQADHGFIVVTIDGRGTPRRGREWERAVAGNLIDIALEDQVAGLRALGERFGEMDLTRVGVVGWSFGGYFSALAVEREPELFRAGIAGAPVADWRDYDTHYTERYMGMPDTNAAGYDASSVLTYAADLTRPLMIIHGTADDNVYFTHAVKMSDALLRAGKDHEFIALAGSTHMVADPKVDRALGDRMMAFWNRHLQ